MATQHHCNTSLKKNIIAIPPPHPPKTKRGGGSPQRGKFLEMANCYTVPLLFLALVKFLAFSTSRLAFFTSKFSFFSNISSVCKHIKKVSSIDSDYKNSLKSLHSYRRYMKESPYSGRVKVTLKATNYISNREYRRHLVL